MGVKAVVHTTADQANQVAERIEDVFRCPSDNLEMRPKNSGDNNGGRGPYRYSYSLNQNVSVRDGNPYGVNDSGWPAAAGTPPPGRSASLRSWGNFTGKISSIRKPSDIILFVCEDELSLDDGIFASNPYNWFATSGNATINAVASRHDLKWRGVRGNTQSPFQAIANEDAKGNVSFCDGHAEYFTRLDALRGKHTGNPYPDPNLFPFAR
jgi:prepilin-type processing-associated H-X9-DG protein